MTTHAEGLTWGNSAWNALRFASGIFTSLARLSDDFRLDIANTNRRAIERQTFVSSVQVGLEKLYSGNYDDVEWETVEIDEDDFCDVEGEED